MATKARSKTLRVLADPAWIPLRLIVCVGVAGGLQYGLHFAESYGVESWILEVGTAVAAACVVGDIILLVVNLLVKLVERLCVSCLNALRKISVTRIKNDNACDRARHARAKCTHEQQQSEERARHAYAMERAGNRTVERTTEQENSRKELEREIEITKLRLDLVQQRIALQRAEAELASCETQIVQSAAHSSSTRRSALPFSGIWSANRH